MITVVITGRLGRGQNVAKEVEQAGSRAIVVPGTGADMRLGDVMQQEKANLDIFFYGSGDAGALTATTKYGYPEKHDMRPIEKGVAVINDGRIVLGFDLMDQEELDKRVAEASIKKHGAQKIVTQKGAVIMDATRWSTQTVIASGKDNRKDEAFTSALSDISKKVLKETTEALIRTKPKEVTIRQAEGQVYIEEFLFFFFPRKRVIYHVKLAVEVEIQAITVEEVDFLMETVKEPNAVVIPFLSKKGV